MGNSENFQINYDGPALVSHEINVRDLAPALLALAEVLEDSNKVLNGEKVKIVVNLKATSEGSVDIGLSVVQSFLDQATTLFNGDEINSVINAHDLLKILFGGGIGSTGVIGLIKWLKNRKISKVTKLTDGRFKLEIDGEKDIAYVSNYELKIFGLISIRRGLESIIKKPLLNTGINKVSFSKDKELLAEVNDFEANYFSMPDIEDEVLGDTESITTLQIVSVTFLEGGKWKFSDGNASFFAEVIDEDFIRKVQKNQASFSKDDLLKVTLRAKQTLNSLGAIRTDYTVVKVLDHRSAAVQINLPFE